MTPAATGSDQGDGAPRVFTIPPGAPFLETLSDALLDGTLVPGFSRDAGPLGLAAATIYVPTRRSARALGATMASRLGGASALLPRIVPLGALDDTELLFEEPGFGAELGVGLPVALSPIHRRMILTRLILAWGQAVRHAIVAVEPDGRRSTKAEEPLLVATSPADAWHLSGELATLIDELAIENVEWHRMEPLGTDEFDRYWRITLDFLDVAITQYPAILQGLDRVDAATRQIALIDAECDRLLSHEPGSDAPRGPVIVAGSTGTNSATARLIAAVSLLPQGAVVLPGLDQGLDEASWRLIGGLGAGDAEIDPVAGHPQAALRGLVAAMGVERAAVRPLGTVPPDLRARGRLIGEALRPAATTELWRHVAEDASLDADAALRGVTLIEAADENEEARAIAVRLRETLEGPGTAALVTPDRELARRVREELTRWGIDIEESSGEPLGQTAAGALARLVLDGTLRDLAPVEVLALLHHPAVKLGRARGEVIRAARQLELAVLRGVLPPLALADPERLMAMARDRRDAPHAGHELRIIPDAEFASLGAFLRDLLAALHPLRIVPREAPLPAWLAAHEAALAALTRDADGEVSLAGADYSVLGDLFEELDGAADPAIRLDRPGYAALFDRLAAEAPVRGPNRSHPRLKILGLLEARLLSADLMVLGGLDETVWPPAGRQDPFLNRPMRAALGLSPPERRLGRTAHDFEMALGQPNVLVTRAKKRGGSPTVPSRFLQRLGAVAPEALDAARARGTRYLAYARALDRPAGVRSIGRPSPRPPVALRPQKLSVTRIETLRRDPYAIYAEKVLRLSPLEPLAAAMGMREYGTSFHGVISAVTRALEDTGRVPDMEGMEALARDAFAEALRDPQFRAFQWPRILGWARAFIAWDAEQRREPGRVFVEESGSLPIPLHDGSIFTLTATADRIEVDAAGRATIVDFKTGASPSIREVKVGFAPQLTLEAEMVKAGAFAAIGGVTGVSAAVYVKFGADDMAKRIDLDWKGDPPFADVVAEHREELVRLLNSFRSESTGYLARPFPKYASRFGTYDHLARVKEWSATGGAGEGAEPS
ncbi:double-strand break repair protein AddB [Lichenibacterium minor]|uniref:Double-strand break repair protein AddB n=1 Tax=Lichenibacterium minor TaxID=2316528 RepID=A0A4Q2U9L2_9HYPH|nr:double-strand break repair protein AddB [Lichenibacterium minor]RYC33230.1 double-strand break repair protein AddB [Lichenibacterium minor]